MADTAVGGWRRALSRYGSAVVAVALALLLRKLVTHRVGEDLPTYITFYPAVMLVAVFAGLGPGLAATVLASVAVDYFILQPQHSLHIHRAVDIVGLVMFVGMGVFISVVAHLYHRARRRTAEYDKQRALGQTRAQLETVVEAMNEGIVVCDLNGRFVHWNRAALAMHGFASVEECRHYLPDISERFELASADGAVLPPEQRPLARILRGEDLHDLELHVRRLPGSDRRIFSYSGRLIRDPSGPPFLALLTITDITERKQAEQQLRLQAAALESAANAIAITDARGSIQWVNPAFTALTGYSAGQALGQNPRVLKSGQHDPAFYQNLWNTILAGHVWHGEMVNKRQDGSLYTEEMTITPLKDPQGKIARFIAIKQDVTARKEAEDTLRRTAEDLARSNHDLEQFAYVASHDLQEPLRMVSGFVQLFHEKYRGQVDADGERYIHYAVDGAKRMQELIADLLTYSRASRVSPESSVTDSGQALEKALVNLHAAIEADQAVITHGPLPAVCVNAGQLTQVFQNLIGNAVKFHGPQPPQVHVEARREGPQWVFSVADNGIGIEPQYYERIFNIFQRLHGREQYPGTGIGLAICKKIVERHHGRIWVESQPGVGSTFCFALPAS
jgi:PAS domain S-box-containing protein